MGPRRRMRTPDQDCEPSGKFRRKLASAGRSHNSPGGSDASRQARRNPCSTAPAARTKVIARGIALSRSEAAASIPSTMKAAASSREPRQSKRQSDDSFDDRMQFRVLRPLAAHAPAPELIVLAIQQA